MVFAHSENTQANFIRKAGCCQNFLKALLRCKRTVNAYR
jgi:hypothetical protein